MKYICPNINLVPWHSWSLPLNFFHIFLALDNFRLAVWNSSSMCHAFCKIARLVCLAFLCRTSLRLNQMAQDTIMTSSNRSFPTLYSNFKCQIRSSNLGKLTPCASKGIPDSIQISCAFSQPQKTCPLLSDSNLQASQVELSITLCLHKLAFVGMMFLHARHVNDLTLLEMLRPQSVF